jgi:hypothetical protein
VLRMTIRVSVGGGGGTRTAPKPAGHGGDGGATPTHIWSTTVKARGPSARLLHQVARAGGNRPTRGCSFLTKLQVRAKQLLVGQTQLT